MVKIAKTTFSDDLAVFCFPEIFRKLSSEIKIRTSIEYLKNPGSIKDEQSAGIVEFIAGSKGKVLKAIIEQDCVDALVGYNLVLPLTKKEISTSIKAATEGGLVQITAVLLEIQNGSKKAFEKEKTEISKKEKGNKADWKKPKAGTTLIGRYEGYETKVLFPLEYSGIEITGTDDVAGNGPDNYKNIQTIIIPEGYTSIGKNTFAGCEKLVSVTLPSTLRSIGSGAFRGCKSLETIVFPNNVVSLGKELFEGCNLQTVELPSNLEFLPKQCFDGAIVDAIIFRGSILSGDGRIFDWGNEPKAFYTDGKIKLYNITKRVLKPLKELENRGVIKEKTEVEIKKEWSVSELTDGTLRIDDYKGLDSDIIIPEKIAGKTVTELGDGVFDAGNDMIGIGHERKVSALQKDVRTHISSITLPSTVVRIGKETFMDCSVKVVRLSDSITEIGERAFRNCKNLQEINIPAGLKIIGKEAFSGIHTIEKWFLPQGLETICQGAFVYSSMIEIHIPDTVTTIGESAISSWGNEELTVFGKAGSEAEEWAKINKLRFEQE